MWSMQRHSYGAGSNRLIFMSVPSTKTVEAISDSEAAIGSGNSIDLINGNMMIKVGFGMNESKSIRSIPNGAPVTGKVQVHPKGTVPSGGTGTAITETNGVAPAYGDFLLDCANSAKIVTGAKGFSVDTKGSIVLASNGLMNITAAQLSLGSKQGRVLVEGEHIVLAGKSVEAVPSDGQFVVSGTLGATGNVVVGGLTHSEGLSFVHGTCTGRNEKVKGASHSDLTTGPAFWGSPINVEGTQAALSDLSMYVQLLASDPVRSVMSGGLRSVNTLMDKIMNLVYVSLPSELSKSGGLVQTGFCIINNAPVPIYNFPHVHAIPEGFHDHTVRVPNMDYSADTAEDVRAKAGAAHLPAPVHRQSAATHGFVTKLFSSVGNTVLSLVQSLGAFIRKP